MALFGLALFLLLAAETIDAQGSYFVTFPQRLIRGSNLDVTIDILQEGVTVPVEVALETIIYDYYYDYYDYYYNNYYYYYNTLQSISGNFSKGVTGKLSLPIDPNVECNECRISVRGQGALQFENSAYVYFYWETVNILIQTDKAIYRPSQTVQYRVLAVYPDLKLYTGKFNVEIRDPNNNKIKVLQGLQGSYAVVEGSLDLSDLPAFGTWSLSVSLETLRDTATQAFEVAAYDLPMFEVTVELPPYALLYDYVLTGKVKAMYTFGQPVSGIVELHAGYNVPLQPDACGGYGTQTTQISFEINGESSFTIAREDLERAAYIYDGSEVRVTAFVTEATTGVRLNGTSVIKFYQNQFQVWFLDTTPNVFKPGLPYTAFIRVSSPDRMPPPGSNNVISVYTYVEYTTKLPDQGLYAAYSFSGTYPLPGQNLTLPASGLLSVDINIPTNATSINIKVTFGSIVITKSVYKAYSKSANYIQLSLLDKNIKSGQFVRVKVEGTEPLLQLTYEVVSRSSVVNIGRIDGNGDKELTFTLKVTPSMAPTAYLVVYYDRNNDEIVADILAFTVDGLFDNKVSVAFSTNETKPGQKVNVVVTADAESQVHILAIDQSVLLLKAGNDITSDKVKNVLLNYNDVQAKRDSDSAWSYSAKTVTQLFNDIGFAVLSDLPLYNPEPGNKFHL
ncbi:unnamed protein product [Lymnaea stagnalis]|uniref:Alpha-2-macroglobulin bait region domain-containing protein n=1 Tax=Lymnaea stagnalis TaxID=6523 RepID=A0AAV2HEM9_LYMST